MTQYDNNNRGALFKNNKRTNDKQPEYNGSVEVNNVEYYISAWVKESKNGQKFFSLSFTPKDQQQASVTPSVTEDVNDSIPF